MGDFILVSEKIAEEVKVKAERFNNCQEEFEKNGKMENKES